MTVLYVIGYFIIGFFIYGLDKIASNDEDKSLVFLGPLFIALCIIVAPFYLSIKLGEYIGEKLNK